MGSAKSGGYVNGGSIDPVIVGMGPDKMNANDPVKSPGHISVANANDYTIVVPFDVEDDPTVPDGTGGKNGSTAQVIGVAPLRRLEHRAQIGERLAYIRVLRRECFEGASGDKAHIWGVSPSRVLPSWEHRMIPLRARQ